MPVNFLRSLQKLLTTKKYFLLDLDGTLYKGAQLFPFTKKFLKTLRKSGRKPIFLTNNSSKSTQEYFQKLKKIGLNPQLDEIYTSGRATIEYLKKRNIQKIFLLGTPSLQREFREAGLMIVDRTSPKTSQPQAVVLAFDITFTYQKFCLAHDLIMSGVPFYATHPDRLLPLEADRYHPDIGTLIEAFFASTGKRPKIIGKPQKIIYEQLHRRLHCKKEEMIAFGDRISTDIQGAKKYGITSVLVLSGEAKKSDLAKSKIKPDFVLKDISQIIPLIEKIPFKREKYE